jgi:hypothetical protein
MFVPNPGKQEDWIRFAFEKELPCGLYWVELEQVAGVSWCRSLGEEPAGTKTGQWNALEQAWHPYRGYHVVETAEWVPFRGCHTFRLNPESRPHTGDQVINGVSRPADWPNAWISDPELPLPQSLTLVFPQPISLGEILLTFDTDLDHRQPPRFCKKTVRHYRLWARLAQGNREELIAEKTDNYHRRRRHDGRGNVSNALRVEVLATNGSPSARIFEVRVYASPVEQKT